MEEEAPAKETKTRSPSAAGTAIPSKRSGETLEPSTTKRQSIESAPEPSPISKTPVTSIPAPALLEGPVEPGHDTEVNPDH